MSDYPRYVVIGILALLIVAAGVGAMVGAAWERLRKIRREDEAWDQGFDAGCGVDDQRRKLEQRARLGR